MILIRAIVRPERSDAVLAALMEAGFPAVTKCHVYGRGKQRGLKVGDVHYDELPKELLYVMVPRKDKDFALQTIMQAARTGPKGAYGDGKIFITAVEESYTVSSGVKEVATTPLPVGA